MVVAIHLDGGRRARTSPLPSTRRRPVTASTDFHSCAGKQVMKPDMSGPQRVVGARRPIGQIPRCAWTVPAGMSMSYSSEEVRETVHGQRRANRGVALEGQTDHAPYVLAAGAGAGQCVRAGQRDDPVAGTAMHAHAVLVLVETEFLSFHRTATDLAGVGPF